MRLPLAALLLMPLLVASVPKAAAVAPRAPELPSLDAGHWLNSPPLTLAALRGRLVLIEFWTFGCSNCRNTLPWLEHVHARYSPKGLAVIAVHTPEFDSERDRDAVAGSGAARHPVPRGASSTRESANCTRATAGQTRSKPSSRVYWRMSDRIGPRRTVERPHGRTADRPRLQTETSWPQAHAEPGTRFSPRVSR